MEYRVTRLLEPELVDFASSSLASRGGLRGWLTPWVGLGLLVLVPGLLSGSRREAVAAASNRIDAVETREEIPMDEWIRIAGIAPAAPVADVEPPRPQWSIRLPDAEDTPGAQQLLAGNAQSLAIGALPVDLGRLRKMYDAAKSQMQLAKAGGQVRLVGGDLPPWMWSDAQSVVDAPRARSVLVTMPPMLDGQARVAGVSAWVEGINYSDPTGVGLPLLRAGGFMEHRLSEHFSVRDFATRDLAPFMRVAIDLVAGLESLRGQVGPITVISGYRHPRYNARADVGGARYSRHQAGQAADVHSPTQSSIEIAQAAIQTMGCGIGLGLGRNTVHIDVRGYLSTWTYPGAPLRESVFDQWILSLCGGSALQAPPQPRQMTNEEWLALVADGAQDEAEVVHVDEALVEDAVREAESAPVRLSADQLVQRDLAEFARDGFEREGHGVVVVDLRDGAVPEGLALQARARYVRATMPELRRMRVDALLQGIQNRPEGAFFVYAILLPGNETRPGVAPTASLPGNAVPMPPLRLSSPDPLPQPGPRPLVPPLGSSGSGEAAAAPARWHLLLATVPSLEAANQEVAYYQTFLAAAGLTVAPHVDGRGGSVRYRVAIGPFTTRTEAEAALKRLRPLIGSEVELVELEF